MSIEQAVTKLAEAITEHNQIMTEMPGKLAEALGALKAGEAAPAAAAAATATSKKAGSAPAAAGSKKKTGSAGAKKKTGAAGGKPTVAKVKKAAADYANRDKSADGQRRLVDTLRPVAAALGVKKIGDIEETQAEQAMGYLGQLTGAYDAAVEAEEDPLEAVEAVEIDAGGGNDDSPL